MSELVQYGKWIDDSMHVVYEDANQRRQELFDQKLEGLQVKIKRTSDGKFSVKIRTPLPVKPNKTTKAKKAPTKTESKSTTKTPSTKRKPTRKSSKKRK